MLLAAMMLCLDLDGVPVQVELTDPLVVTATAAGQTVRFSRWDRNRLESELRGRGFTEGQVRSALAPMRLVDPTTEALPCGACQIGTWFARKKDCGAYDTQTFCVRCKPCPIPPGEPIARMR